MRGQPWVSRTPTLEYGKDGFVSLGPGKYLEGRQQDLGHRCRCLIQLSEDEEATQDEVTKHVARGRKQACLQKIS